jgi:hypothetical protein
MAPGGEGTCRAVARDRCSAGEGQGFVPARDAQKRVAARLKRSSTRERNVASAVHIAWMAIHKCAILSTCSLSKETHCDGWAPRVAAARAKADRHRDWRLTFTAWSAYTRICIRNERAR